MAVCAFIDGDGRDIPPIGAREARRLLEIVARTGPSRAQLWENAGRSFARWVIDVLGDGWADQQVLVLAGLGNTGAIGVVAGRHLANHGGKVSLLVTYPGQMSREAKREIDTFRDAGGRVSQSPPAQIDLVIDAILGPSVPVPLRSRQEHLIEMANRTDATVLAVDIPSGVHGSTDEASGPAVIANATMTFGLPKDGLCSPLAGELVLCDVGIPAEAYRQLRRIEGAGVFRGNVLIPLRRA